VGLGALIRGSTQILTGAWDFHALFLDTDSVLWWSALWRSDALVLSRSRDGDALGVHTDKMRLDAGWVGAAEILSRSKDLCALAVLAFEVVALVAVVGGDALILSRARQLNALTRRRTGGMGDDALIRSRALVGTGTRERNALVSEADTVLQIR